MYNLSQKIEIITYYEENKENGINVRGVAGVFGGVACMRCRLGKKYKKIASSEI